MQSDLMPSKPAAGQDDPLTYKVIGAAIEVHKHLGPGLLESAYQQCLAWELEHRGVVFRTEVPLPVVYKGQQLDCGYRLDFVVENDLILEIKSVEELAPIHEAQLLTYLRISRLHKGLLMNFNNTRLLDGIKRRVL